jgi:hypothetical protein
MKRSPENTGEKRGRRCMKMSAKAKRILALLNDPKHRTRLTSGINRADQDEPTHVGKDQEMTILKEINDLQQFQDDVWSKGGV